MCSPYRRVATTCPTPIDHMPYCALGLDWLDFDTVLMYGSPYVRAVRNRNEAWINFLLLRPDDVRLNDHFFMSHWRLVQFFSSCTQIKGNRCAPLYTIASILEFLHPALKSKVFSVRFCWPWQGFRVAIAMSQKSEKWFCMPKSKT